MLLARYVGLRHELGFFPCRGGHVISQGASEEYWLSRCGTVVRPGNRRGHAHHKSLKESQFCVNVLTIWALDTA